MRGGARGLARSTRPGGRGAYATRRGSVARNGDGKNGCIPRSGWRPCRELASRSRRCSSAYGSTSRAGQRAPDPWNPSSLRGPDRQHATRRVRAHARRSAPAPRSRGCSGCRQGRVPIPRLRGLSSSSIPRGRSPRSSPAAGQREPAGPDARSRALRRRRNVTVQCPAQGATPAIRDGSSPA